MINKKNRILAVFFIAFFAVNIILPSIILFHFKVNQEYIAANLCIEKDLEESTCEGSCQLKKSLDSIEKGSSNQDELTFNVESHINYLFAPILSVNKVKEIKESLSFSDYENNNTLSGFYDIPFLPPILLS